MKTLLPLFALFSVALFAGCQNAAQLNSVHIGMTKAEVIAAMGQPDSTAAQANAEYFTYYLYAESDYRDQPYLVRFVDGKVESFGRFAQLYDLYNRPVAGGPQGPNVGVNPMLMNPANGGPMMGPTVMSAPAPAAAPDLATQIEHLKALKDQGVLTDAEFQQAKQKLLTQDK